MKYLRHVIVAGVRQSHPARGAWIEILFPPILVTNLLMSHPARGAWIEIVHKQKDR